MKRFMILAAATLAIATSTGCRCGGVRSWWNRTFYRGDACETTCGMDGGGVMGQPGGEFPAMIGPPTQPFGGQGFPPPGEIIPAQ